MCLCNFYGWNLHNIIGLPDAWAIGPTSTDNDIDAYMDWPEAVTNDAQSLSMMRNYAKFHRGHEESFEGEEPEPDPPPDATTKWREPVRLFDHSVMRRESS